MTLVSDFLSKDSRLIDRTVTGFLPRTVYIPLNYKDNDSFEILISEGQSVTEGQTVSKSLYNSIHSSVSGTVAGITDCTLHDGAMIKAAKINLGGSLSYTGHKITETDWQAFSSDEINFLLGDKGVVNTFSGCVPLCNQIRSSEKPAGERILVVRLFDEDPSRVVEKILAENFIDKIITGSRIIAKALMASGIVFVHDKKTSLPDITDRENIETAFTEVDAKYYPCGFMHELTQAVKKSHKNSVFDKLGSKDLFIDSETAIRAFYAVVCSMPVMDNYVHVTGDCLNSAAVIKVKIGTTLSDMVFQCGGFKKKPGKIIINGIVTGNSVGMLDIPVTSAIKSVEFLTRRQVPDQLSEKCIRCGACSDICPVGLYPESLYRVFINNDSDTNELSMSVQNTAALCTGCAMCNTVCPSRLPLCQVIESLKDNE